MCKLIAGQHTVADLTVISGWSRHKHYARPCLLCTQNSKTIAKQWASLLTEHKSLQHDDLTEWGAMRFTGTDLTVYLQGLSFSAQWVGFVLSDLCLVAAEKFKWNFTQRDNGWVSLAIFGTSVDTGPEIQYWQQNDTFVNTLLWGT